MVQGGRDVAVRDGQRRNRYVVNHRIIESLSVGMPENKNRQENRHETDGCCSSPAALSGGRRSKQRDVHNDDAVRRLPEFLRFFPILAVESHAVPAHPLPTTDESGHSDSNGSIF